MDNIWEQFSSLSGNCYMEMLSPERGTEPWLTAFEAFRNALDTFINEDDGGESAYKETHVLKDLENDTDWAYDFSGWLTDFLDELIMAGDYTHTLEALDYLRDKFDWSSDDDFSIRGREVDALLKTNQLQKADQKSKEWVTEEPENPAAVSCRIYCCTQTENSDEIQNYIKEWIPGGCQENNFGIFAAVENYYRTAGDTENQAKIKAEMEAFQNRKMTEMMSGIDPEMLRN